MILTIALGILLAILLIIVIIALIVETAGTLLWLLTFAAGYWLLR